MRAWVEKYRAFPVQDATEIYKSSAKKSGKPAYR